MMQGGSLSVMTAQVRESESINVLLTIVID